jgi:glutamyl endopeptidase
MELKSRTKPTTGTEADTLTRPSSPTKRSVLPGGSGRSEAAAARPKQRVVVGKRSDSLAGMGGGLLTVIGQDERSRIRDTEDPPFRMVCALAIKGPWGDFVGTGWLAGPRTLITAGHCVFDRNQMGGWAESIQVTPAQDGDEPLPFGSFMATRFSTVDRWEDQQDPDFDIAAIHLNDRIGDRLGWFAVGAFTDSELQDFLVNVSGYPGNPGGGVQQWWARNRIKAVTPRRIFYDVDTSGGQSGGPAYIFEEGKPDTPIVVGIHAYGVGGTPRDVPLVVNSAPRIIPEVVEQIRAWVAADDASS